jgi:hypothetical protein
MCPVRSVTYVSGRSSFDPIEKRTAYTHVPPIVQRFAAVAGRDDCQVMLCQWNRSGYWFARVYANSFASNLDWRR